MIKRVPCCTAFAAIILVLSACSGGGGGGGGGVATIAVANPQRTLDTSYSDVRSAAQLRPENSLTFLARTLEAVEFIPAFGNLLEQNSPQYDYSFFRTEEDTLFDAQEVINESQLCDSGTSTVLDELDPGNGLGLVRQVFASCFVAIDSEFASNGGASIDGELWVSVRRRNANGAVTLHDVEVVDMDLTDYVGRRVQINGTIAVSEGRLAGTLEMNFLSESVRILLEDFVYQPNADVRYRGRVYQSGIGYADFTAEQTFATTGYTYALQLDGANSSGVRIAGTEARDNIGSYVANYDVEFYDDVEGEALNQTTISHEQLYRRISQANRQPVPTIVAVERFERASPAELIAGNSTDPDADFLFYRWSVESEPDGCGATITSADSAVAQLNADCVGAIELSLTVDDRNSTPVSSTSVVTALNYPADFSIDTSTQLIAAGQPFSAQVTIANPEDGPFEISLISGPNGMEMDELGQISWDSGRLPILADALDVNIAVEVSNERDVRQDISLRVTNGAVSLPFVHATVDGYEVSVADLDADGRQEALFIGRDDTLYALEIAGGNIEQKWAYNRAYAYNNGTDFEADYQFVDLADVNNDQIADLILVAGNIVHVLDAQTHEELLSVDLAPYLPDCGRNCGIDYFSMLVADIDDDRQAELLTLSYAEDDNGSNEITARMISLSSGEVTYTLSNVGGGVNASFYAPVANLDSDSNLEILTRTEIWDFVDGTVRSLPTEMTAFSEQIRPADLNGDGNAELLRLVPGVNGGDPSQIIRLNPGDFSELGRITLPSLSDSNGTAFNDHDISVLGDIDSTPGDEILLTGNGHNERAVIDSVDEINANIKLRHSDAPGSSRRFAYGDFSGAGNTELLALPVAAGFGPLQLVGSSGVIVSDSLSYTARGYSNLKGGSLLSPGVDPNTVYFAAADHRPTDTPGFDSRMQRITFDLASEQFTSLGAPNAFIEAEGNFTSSFTHLLEYLNSDLNDDGVNDLILYERRGSRLPSSASFWTSVFDGQDMSKLLEYQVLEASETFFTFSVGIPSDEDDSFSIYSSQFDARLFIDGDLTSSVPVRGKPLLQPATNNTDASLNLIFLANADYSDADNQFSRGFNIADVNLSDWTLTSTPIETLIPFFDYENWFLVHQDIDGDAVDETIIAATKSESDYDNRSELIVLNDEKEVLARTIINGRVTALGRRAYGSGSPNVWLAVTNHDYLTTRSFVSGRVISVDALSGIKVWQSPEYSGAILDNSLHIIDPPAARPRLSVSTGNYVMISR